MSWLLIIILIIYFFFEINSILVCPPVFFYHYQFKGQYELQIFCCELNFYPFFFSSAEYANTLCNVNRSILWVWGHLICFVYNDNPLYLFEVKFSLAIVVCHYLSVVYIVHFLFWSSIFLYDYPPPQQEIFSKTDTVFILLFLTLINLLI